MLTERLELAMSRDRAEIIVASLERPINRNLIKLVGIAAPESDRRRWTAETREWLGEIARIVNASTKRRFPSGFYLRILFTEPFGGNEVEKVRDIIASILKEIEEQGLLLCSRSDVPETEIIKNLEKFHLNMSVAISSESFTAI